MNMNKLRSRSVRMVGAISRELTENTGQWRGQLSACAVSILDKDFNRTAPIPWMDDELLLSFQHSEVVLPPRAWFGEGNQSLDGLSFLVGLTRTLNLSSIFEIGTYNGVTAWTLARNANGIVVDTLDLHPDESPSMQIEPGDNNHRIHLETRAYALPSSCGEVHQHWGDSASFDFQPWAGKCDLVYIDGAHSGPYVQSDTEHAFKMRSKSGVIVWDDYWRPVKGVREVLDRLAAGELQGELLRVPSTRLVVYLPPMTSSVELP